MKNKNQDNSLEEVVVLLSPLEKILVEMPLIGDACEQVIYKKYQKLLPAYKIILY